MKYVWFHPAHTGQSFGVLEDSEKGRELVQLAHDFFESWYRCFFLPSDIAKLTPSYR
jgi:hypothetical protein